ncbi:hypothetical protein [Pseudoalteromonas ardens]|nr:hypothetical protein [Pseudoalteromonas sp. R96]MDK1312643.1 hypothetical protein [Pseudoalteromonas sp. R96]
MEQLHLEKLKSVKGGAGIGSPDLPGRVQVSHPDPKKSCRG